MPKFKLPKPKRVKEKKAVPVDEYDDWEWRRKVHGIPANKAVLDSLEAGEPATIVLKGKVTSTINETNTSGNGRIAFDFEIAEVEVAYEDSNVYSKMSEDDE